MCSGANAVVKARERLAQIGDEAGRLKEKTQAAFDEVNEMVDELVRRARRARNAAKELANLKAEATVLRLKFDLKSLDLPVVENRVKDLSSAWRNLRAALQPVRPSSEWLERVKDADRSQVTMPALTSEERDELERRLKDNVCPICISFSLDGSCTDESFDHCPITQFLDSLVAMIQEMGHRPWMEEYFEHMYREICPGCSAKEDADHCPPREEGDCSLFTYLPTVVRTIEDFMKERTGSEIQLETRPE